MIEITTESFTERIDRLFYELERAVRFDRPSILLAIYRSEFVRADAEEALAERLQALGQTTRLVFINEQNQDLPLYLQAQSDQATTVYFVSGLRFGGGEDGRSAYRAVNIRREYFVAYRLRVVFWLTEQEAFYLPRYAPDFWAFRHRTVEFMDSPDDDCIGRHAANLAWRGWQGELWSDAPAFTEDTAAKIAYRERLLAELPAEPETTAMRVDLLFTLGPLYAAQGEYEVALAALQQAVALDPQDAYLRYELGNVYRAQGRNDEALAIYQQAVVLDPKYATLHNGLGHVYAVLGRYEEAL
ncbi:MAG: tetratricopeptide repeat protein, partial [Anaerolineales bacterium]|nr:tetratricopeptide repeat protein [Anaerolineales bacterium]